MFKFYLIDGSAVSYFNAVWRYSDSNCSVEGANNILRWWLYKYGCESLLLRMGLMDAISFSAEQHSVVVSNVLTLECVRLLIGVRCLQCWLRSGDEGLQSQVDYMSILNFENYFSCRKFDLSEYPSDFSRLCELLL